MYEYSPLKRRRYPAIKDISRAFTLADHQQDTARDTRPLAACSMRIADLSSRLQGNIQTRSTALTSFDWTIEDREGNDQEGAALVTSRLETVIDNLIEWHTDTPLYGGMAIELEQVADDAGGAVAPNIVRRYYPTEIETNGPDPWDIMILDDGAKPIRRPVGVPSRQNWIVDVGRSFARGGIFRSLLDPETLRHENRVEWANYNRKLKGLITATYEAIDEVSKAAAVDALQTFVGNNAAVLPKGIEIELNSMTDGKGAGSLQQFMEYIDADGAIAIVGQANTMQLPDNGGSRAALQVLNYVRGDIMFSDMRRTERLINRQLLLWDEQLNGNPNAKRSRYRFAFNISEEYDPETMARVAIELHQAGFMLDAEETYRLMGRKRPEGVPDVIEGAEPNSPAALGLM